MRYLCVLLIALSLICFPVFANTIGFTYGEALDERNYGIHGDYESQLTDVVKLGAEGQFQYGEALLGNLDVAVTLGNERLGVRFESNNNYKGADLNDVGRTNALGASLVFPLFGLEVSGGVFGKTGNPFQPTYKLADPTDPASAELADSGILIKEESTLNLALKTEFDWKRLEVSLRGLFEVAGEGDKYHQLDVGLETGGQFTEKLGWLVQFKGIGQLVALEDGAKIYTERSVIAGVNYSF